MDGEVGLQNLVKDINTIYTSNVIGVTGNPNPNMTTDEAGNWYEPSYVIGRYKTLTGVEPVGATPTEKINWIRKNENVASVLQYQEYTQFKKAKFERVGDISYSEISGRITGMNFKFTGEIM